jgi:hypothetical protein
VEASAFVGTLDKKTSDGAPISVDDNALCIMRLKKGGMGILRASWTFYGQEDNSTRIYGTKGVLRVYDDPRQSLILEKRDGTVERFELDHITTNAEQTSGNRRTTGVIDALLQAFSPIPLPRRGRRSREGHARHLRRRPRRPGGPSREGGEGIVPDAHYAPRHRRWSQTHISKKGSILFVGVRGRKRGGDSVNASR